MKHNWNLLRLQFETFLLAVSLFFRWYDLWIGAFYDSEKCALYICPLPTVGLCIRFHSLKPELDVLQSLCKQQREMGRLEKLSDLQLCAELVDADFAENEKVYELMRRVEPDWMFKLDGSEVGR
jgi:hypothetical protein